jgi:hypothetical protein
MRCRIAESERLRPDPGARGGRVQISSGRVPVSATRSTALCRWLHVGGRCVTARLWRGMVSSPFRGPPLLCPAFCWSKTCLIGR